MQYSQQQQQQFYSNSTSQGRGMGAAVMKDEFGRDIPLYTQQQQQQQHLQQQQQQANHQTIQQYSSVNDSHQQQQIIDWQSDPIGAMTKFLMQPQLYHTAQPLPYSQFSQMINAVVDPALIAARYDQYTAEFHERRLKMFFTQHQHDQWFISQYSQQPQSQVLLNWNLVKQEMDAGHWNTITFHKSADQSAEQSAEQQQTLEQQQILKSNMNSKDQKSKWPTLELRNLHKDLTREQLEQVFQGDAQFQYLVVGDAMPQRNYLRNAWVVLNGGASVQEFMERYNGSVVSVREYAANSGGTGESVSGGMLSDPAVPAQTQDVEVIIELVPVDEQQHYQRVQYTDVVASDSQRMRVDLINVVRLLRLVCSNAELYHLMMAHLAVRGAFRQFEDVTGLVANVGLLADDEVRQSLDIYMLVLRRVFYWDYYSAQRGVHSAEDFLSRFGSDHQRPAGSVRPESAKSKNWCARLDKFYGDIMGGVDAYKTQGEQQETSINISRKQVAVPVVAVSEAEQEAMLLAYQHYKTVKLDAAKYKCGIVGCGKLFKGAEFVGKHLINKHAEIIAAYRAVIAQYVQYCADPLKYTLQDGAQVARWVARAPMAVQSAAAAGVVGAAASVYNSNVLSRLNYPSAIANSQPTDARRQQRNKHRHQPYGGGGAAGGSAYGRVALAAGRSAPPGFSEQPQQSWRNQANAAVQSGMRGAGGITRTYRDLDRPVLPVVDTDEINYG